MAKTFTPTEWKFARSFFNPKKHGPEYPYQKSRRITRKARRAILEIGEMVRTPYISKNDTREILADLYAVVDKIRTEEKAIMDAKKAPESFDHMRGMQLEKERSYPIVNGTDLLEDA